MKGMSDGNRGREKRLERGGLDDYLSNSMF